MSHLTTVKFKIKDLDALGRACDRLGLELRRNKKFFNWYGSGSNLDGKCDHTIAVKGSPVLSKADRSKPYEVGVISNGQGEFEMKLDFHAGGNGLVTLIGDRNLNKLTQMYLVEVQKAQMKKDLTQHGFTIVEKPQANGEIHVVATRNTGGAGGGF